MKYLKFVRGNFDDPKFPVFSISDLRASLGLMGIKQAYLKRMLNYLSRKGEVVRVAKGAYTFHNDITVVGFAFKPFYYGLENALTILKLWDQNTNPVVITWKNVRAGERKFGDGNYLVQRLSRKLFFGYELVRYYDFWVPVSDCEKTLIDLVYYKHHISGDVLASFKKQIDRRRLNAYLKMYPPRVKSAVKKLIK